LGAVNFNQMRIEIVNKEGELVTDFELETNPFKTGETINVQVSNYDTSFWTTGEVRGDFVVEKIEHFLRKDYTRNQTVSTVFTVSVQVSPI
jgi:acyl dehydratase